MIAFHPFGLLRVTEEGMMLLSTARHSAAFMGFLVSCTAVALLSTFLCVRQASTVLRFLVTPIQASLSPRSTAMAAERGEGLGISDAIYHRVTELSPQAPILKAGSVAIWGNAGFLFHCLY